MLSASRGELMLLNIVPFAKISHIYFKIFVVQIEVTLTLVVLTYDAKENPSTD